MSDSIKIRAFSKLEYCDPHKFLTQIRSFELENDLTGTPERIRNLRTNRLKIIREIRDAALFCVGMSELLGHKVYFSQCENEDYDFVTMYSDSSSVHYGTVQLKELVSIELNYDASIAKLISKLSHYADLSSVTVAIRLNRSIRFAPEDLTIPKNINIGSLWVFSSISPDQSEWCIWGDFCSGKIDYGRTFNYPNQQTDS